MPWINIHITIKIRYHLFKLSKFKKYNINEEIYLVVGNKEMDINWIKSKTKILRKMEKLPQRVKLITYNELNNLIKNGFII